jgi:hypothetical protein
MSHLQAIYISVEIKFRVKDKISLTKDEVYKVRDEIQELLDSNIDIGQSRINVSKPNTATRDGEFIRVGQAE